MPDLVIFGIGEFARLARFYFESETDYRVVAFTADSATVGDETTHDHLPLVEFTRLQSELPPDSVEVFVAIGYRSVNRGRAAVYERVVAAGYDCATYVSPHAIVSSAATVGRNCFIFENAVVQPFASVGDDTVIWSSAVVAHDSVIGCHCFLAPMASISGNVVVGDFCFVGNNATVRDGVTLGAATVVGAGAVVKWSTEAGAILRSAGTAPLAERSSSTLDRL